MYRGLFQIFYSPLPHTYTDNGRQAANDGKENGDNNIVDGINRVQMDRMESAGVEGWLAG